jgi:hypothetical protein
MNARVRKVVDEFLGLTEEERELATAEIAAALGDDEEIDDPTPEELARRIDDVVSGRVETRDMDEVLAELRAKYSPR